jgi:hypothetical protein
MMNETQDNPTAEIARLRTIIDDYVRISKAASEEIATLRRRLAWPLTADEREALEFVCLEGRVGNEQDAMILRELLGRLE